MSKVSREVRKFSLDNEGSSAKIVPSDNNQPPGKGSIMSDLLTRVTDAIRNKISNQEMFTLLDVSNAVKNDGGDFYSHTQIHDVAIPILDSLYPSFNYDVSVIDVQLKHGTPARANCYHPMGSDPNNYTNRNQEALKRQHIALRRKQLSKKLFLLWSSPPYPLLLQMLMQPV